MDYQRGSASQIQRPRDDRRAESFACNPQEPKASGHRPCVATSGTATLFEELAELDRDSSAFRRKVDQIVREYLPLADNVARRFAHCGEPWDDLVQVARLGLLNAVYRFDVEVGTEFTSFAVPTIVGGLRRHFRDNSWAMKVPRRLKDLNVQLDVAISELYQRLGRAPAASDLAEELGLDREEVIAALVARSCSKTLSIDGGTDGEHGPPRPIKSLGRSDIGLEQIECWETLRPLLETMSDRERAVLRLRFFESRTQTEIAQHLGISQMHVSRLLRKSLSFLRDHLQDS